MISYDYKVIICNFEKPEEHERLYNAPQIDKVAIIIVDKENTSL